MNNIIKNLFNKDWDSITKAIKNNEIQWDHLVDQSNNTLHYLAYHDKIDLIKLIDSDILDQIIDQPNLEGDTICHLASKLNNIEILELALKINPNIIYQKNKLKCTPFFYLVQHQNLVKKIINQITVEDHLLNDKYTLLEYYIMSRNLTMIDFLLKNIIINQYSNNAIFITIQSDNDTQTKILILKMFLKYNFDINLMNQAFLTPLIASINLNNYHITKFLLENEANIGYYGPENSNHPLTIAIKRSDNALIKLLMKYQIDVNIRDKYLKTPMHYLFESPNNILDKIKYSLLDKIKNINKSDHRMNSILNLLIHNDNWRKYADILEGKKLNIYLKNKDGKKPIDGIITNEMDDFLEMVYKSYLNQLDSKIKWVDPIDKKISLILENGDDIYSYKDYIIGKILKNQSYPLKKHSQMLKIIRPAKTNITHFSAYTYNYICFLYYILEKYPQIKIPGMTLDLMNYKSLQDLYQEMTKDYKDNDPDHSIFRSIIRDYINHAPLLINHVIIWKNYKNYFISPYIVQGIHETLSKYPNTQFIILKLTIASTASFNHANLIIYNVKSNYVERFDPYGKVPFYDGHQIDLLIESFFKDHFPHVKYYSPDMLANGISFQIFSDERNKLNYAENDPAGFCIAWCLWYLEMRIKNIKISPKSLIKRTINEINKSEDKFKDYIRNYSNHLDIEKNKILSNGGVPKKYWYTLHIPSEIYKSYLIYTREKFAKIN